MAASVDLTVRYAAVLADYAARKPVSEIRAIHGVSRQTIARAVQAAGLEKRKGSGSYASKPGFTPGAPARKYDAFRPRPVIPCGCGQNCGFSFVKGKGQAGRKWAKECPFADEIRRANAERSDKAGKARAAALAALSGPRSRGPAPKRERKAIHWCAACGGLAHRRPLAGPCACGEGFQADSFQTNGGLTIVVAPG